MPNYTHGAWRWQTRTPLDAARVKLDFPILAKPVHGKPLVYLDSANSAQKPRAVIDRDRRGVRVGLRERPPRRLPRSACVATDALRGRARQGGARS